MDKLDEMFSLRESFMRQLRRKIPESYPSWPLDLSNKSDQQFCRDMALRGVEEMFEALQHLKNWKPHRKTEMQDFDREELEKLTAIVDGFVKNFQITKDEVQEEMINCRGSLIDLYYIIEEKYKIKYIIHEKRGRPRKNS